MTDGLRVLLVLSALCRTALSHAADDAVRVCVAAHTDGQIRREEGLLLAARAEFAACSDVRCPLVVRSECIDLADRVKQELPSILVAATDQYGRDLPLASATIDSTRSLDSDLGRAIELDPGAHRVELRLSDGRVQRLNFIVRAGEKLRRVAVQFPEPPPAPAPVANRTRPTAALYVLGGIGAAALGSFIYFGLDGKSKERRLDACRPNCTQAEVDRMRSAYLLADISLAVSMVALGVDAYLFFKMPTQAHTQGAAGQPIPDFALGAVGRF
jgi:hypothetical protein